MRMKERKTLEYKENLTNTFLKTVSAFANYNGGTVIFGIDDDGKPVGVSDPKKMCLDIENKINDSITPQPEYELTVNEKDATVSLEVKRGASKPYLYKSKAYKRNDTATIEVDSYELTRLILEGKRINYEELPSERQNLTFHMLEEELKKRMSVEMLSKDVLKTLNLYSDGNGYNNAAAILADKNTFPGVDIARFGESISVIHKRVTYENISILKVYENTVGIYKDYYQYEEIAGTERKKVELIPEVAFREAIANALIHRLWDINAQIRVFMYQDRIEISSPGGLPSGITEEEYLTGNVSILRNPSISHVFYRLGIVEIFGTGILRIMEAYGKSTKKPIFEATENTIKVILPIIESELKLEEDERNIYQLLSKTIPRSMRDLLEDVPYGKTKVTKILKKMETEGIVIVRGRGRGTKYYLR